MVRVSTASHAHKSGYVGCIGPAANMCDMDSSDQPTVGIIMLVGTAMQGNCLVVWNDVIAISPDKVAASAGVGRNCFCHRPTPTRTVCPVPNRTVQYSTSTVRIASALPRDLDPRFKRRSAHPAAGQGNGYGTCFCFATNQTLLPRVFPNPVRGTRTIQ